MYFPSFSLQSTLALSDPRWGAQVLFYLYVFWVVLGFVPWLENLGRIWVRGDWIGSSSRLVLRKLGWESVEAKTAEVPLKLGKDPTKSLLKPRMVSGIRVESPSCGWLRQEGSGSLDL